MGYNARHSNCFIILILLWSPSRRRRKNVAPVFISLLQPRFYDVVSFPVTPQYDVVAFHHPISHFPVSPPAVQSASTPISSAGECWGLCTTLWSHRRQKVLAISPPPPTHTLVYASLLIIYQSIFQLMLKLGSLNWGLIFCN